MRRKSQLRVVVSRCRSCQKNDLRVRSELRLGKSDQLSANATMLPGEVNRQVGKITTKSEVRQRASHSHELALNPSCAQETGMLQHGGDSILRPDRAAFRQAGAFQQIDEQLGADFFVTLKMQIAAVHSWIGYSRRATPERTNIQQRQS